MLQGLAARAFRTISSASGFSAPDISHRVLAYGDGSHRPPEDLGRASPRQIAHSRHPAGLERAPEPLRDQLHELIGYVCTLRVHRRPEAPDRLAFGAVRDADRGRLGDRRVREQLGFDLRRPDALAGRVERFVGAPEQEPLPIVIDSRPVTVAPDPGYIDQ